VDIEFNKISHPLFAKEGYKSSLWKREGRRDLINLMLPTSLVATLH
jgi:hypothetical protein